MSRPAAAERTSAVAALGPDTLQRLLAGTESAGVPGPVLARGVPASPGLGRGRAYVGVERALAALDRGEAVVLVATTTSPADEPVIRHAAAVVTAGGGMASHAAIVARGWGVPAVCGVGSLRVDDAVARFGDAGVGPGDAVVVDGSSGVITRSPEEHAGGDREPPLLTAASELPEEVTELLSWADEVTAGRVAVLANAETPRDAAVAMHLGAAGVGLCRSEHWFLGEHRPLLAALMGENSAPERAGLLGRFGDVTRAATEALVDELSGAPVTVRLLDASPDEFGVADRMPGGRGVRAARTRSDLYRIQLAALVDVATDRAARGEAPALRVLVPMVGDPSDLEFVAALLADARPGGGLALPLGAMIEVPRAALNAAEIARRSAFLSIGTNDLTALTWGLDRNDAPPAWVADPFASLDVTGVGRLIGLAIADARAVDADLDVAVCGEIAGDPASIGALIELGVTALSVAPARVPVARLAAAQALIRLDAGGATPPSGAG